MANSSAASFDAIADVVSLRGMYRLSNALNRAATQEEIYELAVEGVMGAVGVARAAILLRDEAGVMRFRAARGLSSAYRQAVEGHTPWASDAADASPVLISDTRLDSALAALRPAIEAEGIHALAFIPIVSDGRLAGKFMLYYDAPHAFGSAEIEAAMAVAGHVGFALERNRALRQLREERQLFVDGPAVVFKWKAERGWPVEYVSPNVAVLTGYPADAWLGGKVAFEALLHPEDADRVREEIARHVKSGAAAYEQEYRIVRIDGASRWIRDHTRVVRDAHGVPRQFDAYLLDVSEAKETERQLRDLTATLEARVNARTVELADACRELETFTYSVSHDLRGPLRTIDGFSALLRESAVSSGDAESVAMFDRVRSASARMALLIDDMLALTRISRQVLVRRRVDLSALVRMIADDLRKREPSRRVEWRIEEGITATADPDLARLVLENLLSNAWKFTARREQAMIIFERDPAPGQRLLVRDNGVGFDMRYVGSLFHPFQRLHVTEQFEGTGVGLATVARIIQRHGGGIEARGNPGAGAEFRFDFGPAGA